MADPSWYAALAASRSVAEPMLLAAEEIGTDRAVMRLRVRYRFRGDLNAAVRAVVDPDRLVWVEESTYDRPSHVSAFRIVPEHYGSKLQCSGTLAMLPVEDDGAVVRILEGELTVRMPFVGGKVEAAIVSGLRQHAATEETVFPTWLVTQTH